MPARGDQERAETYREDRDLGYRRRRGIASLLAIPLITMIMIPAGSAAARVVVDASIDRQFGFAPTLSDSELADLRGGFNVGGFDIAVGIVARSVVERALGGLGEQLEVVTRFSVPQIGHLASQGTTVRTLDSAAAGAMAAGPPAQDHLATSGFSISTGVGTTMVDLGTTRLTHHMLNTFVENSDLNRVINNQLDINLEIGGFARHLSALRSAQALRPAVDAQIAYGTR